MGFKATKIAAIAAGAVLANVVCAIAYVFYRGFKLLQQLVGAAEL